MNVQKAPGHSMSAGRAVSAGRGISAIHRLVLPLFLAGFCLLAGWGATVRDAQAGPRDVPEREALDRSPIAANGAYTMWFPVAFQEHNAFANGDFDEGLLAWTTGRGPFNGRGSGLPQRVIFFNGDDRALLGLVGELAPGTIPVGYGVLSQTWTLNRRFVSLDYWVVSYDSAKTDEGYFDTFEVSINQPPGGISNAERNAKGCDESARLNPGGTLVVTGPGLVFCGGRPGSSSGIRWDTGGWRTVTLDLNAFQGQNVTLYLALWSREYEAPFHNDQAWFNTWVYIDNIQPRD